MIDTLFSYFWFFESTIKTAIKKSIKTVVEQFCKRHYKISLKIHFKGHNKNVPNVYKYVNPPLRCPSYNSVFLGSHCSTLLIPRKRLILLSVHTLPPKSLNTPISVYAIKHACYSGLGRGKGRVDIFVNWGRF